MFVYAVQIDIAWEDPRENFTRVRAALESDDIVPGSLIVLPEMFATGFTMNVAAAADAHDMSVSFLEDVARQYDSAVLAGVASRGSDGRGLNQAIAIGPDGAALARYTKMHPFTPAGEPKYYAPGDSVVTFQFADFTIAPLICYDLRFPERFREAVRLDAEVFVVIANWPTPRWAHWQHLITARAIENQAYVIGANRVGKDPNHDYPGESIVVDPMGIGLNWGGDGAELVGARLSRQALLDYRREFPVLDDRRE